MKSACHGLVYDFIEYLVFCCIELDIKHFFKYMDSNIKTGVKKYHRLWVYAKSGTGLPIILQKQYAVGVHVSAWSN
jgi:hypothetical protein